MFKVHHPWDLHSKIKQIEALSPVVDVAAPCNVPVLVGPVAANNGEWGLEKNLEIDPE